MSIQNIILAIIASRSLQTVQVQKLRRGVKKVEVRERMRELKEQFRQAGVL